MARARSVGTYSSISLVLTIPFPLPREKISAFKRTLPAFTALRRADNRDLQRRPPIQLGGSLAVGQLSADEEAEAVAVEEGQFEMAPLQPTALADEADAGEADADEADASEGGASEGGAQARMEEQSSVARELEASLLEIATLKAKIESMTEGDYEDNDELIASLTEDNASLREDNASLKEDNASLEDDKASLKDDNVSLKDEIASLKDDKASLKDDKAALKNDNASLKDDNGSLRDKMDAMTTELLTLTKNLSATNDPFNHAREEQPTIE